MSVARELLLGLVAELRADPTLAAELRSILGVASPAPQPEPIYLAVRAYARRLGVSERTAWSWAAAGMPCVGAGRTRRVDVRAADAWLRDRRDVADDAVERQARAAARRAAGPRR